MKASFITDEFSQDLALCLDLACARRIDAVELRSVDGESVAEMDPRSADRIARMTQDRGIAVCGLDTFCFKHDHDGLQNRDSLDRLDRAADIACRLGAPWLRIFAFWRNDNLDRAAVRDAVIAAVDLIGRRGVRVLVENGTFSTLGTGAALAALIEALDRPQVGALWDPANVLNGGWPERVDDGLQTLARHVVHIHAKNPHAGPPGAMRFGPLRAGMIDWRRHLDLCRENGFAGYVSLETHWRTTRTLAGRAQLDFPEGHDFSDGGEEATRLSLDELTGLIAETKGGM